MKYFNNYNTLSNNYSRLFRKGDIVRINSYEDLNWMNPNIDQVVLTCSDVSNLVKFIESGEWEVIDTAKYTNFREITKIDGESEFINGLDMIRTSLNLNELTEEEADAELEKNEKLANHVLGEYKGFLLKKKA